MRNSLFRGIKSGADSLSNDAQTCYALWRDDNTEGAAEVADRMVRQASAVLRQAQDVLDALISRAKAS